MIVWNFFKLIAWTAHLQNGRVEIFLYGKNYSTDVSKTTRQFKIHQLVVYCLRYHCSGVLLCNASSYLFVLSFARVSSVDLICFAKKKSSHYGHMTNYDVFISIFLIVPKYRRSSRWWWWIFWKQQSSVHARGLKICLKCSHATKKFCREQFFCCFVYFAWRRCCVCA